MQVRGEELQTFVRDESILGKDNLHPLQKKKKLFPDVEKTPTTNQTPTNFLLVWTFCLIASLLFESTAGSQGSLGIQGSLFISGTQCLSLFLFPTQSVTVCIANDPFNTIHRRIKFSIWETRSI